jgi:16S rRNA processing protein RimM
VQNLAVVGRIARTHGNRGEVIVNLDTDFPGSRFQPGAELLARHGDQVEPVKLTTVRFQGDRPVIGIAGVDSMTAAEALAGFELCVPVEQLEPLPAGTFYRHDLVGCRVETRRGEAVGVVADVTDASGSSVLVVTGSAGEILVPLASAICVEIDVGGKRIVIDPPEGLLSLNETLR